MVAVGEASRLAHVDAAVVELADQVAQREHAAAHGRPLDALLLLQRHFWSRAATGVGFGLGDLARDGLDLFAVRQVDAGHDRVGQLLGEAGEQLEAGDWSLHLVVGGVEADLAADALEDALIELGVEGLEGVDEVGDGLGNGDVFLLDDGDATLVAFH